MRYSTFSGCVGLVLSAGLMSCSSDTEDNDVVDGGPTDAGPVSALPGLPGYFVSVWAQGVRDGGPGDYYNPDSIDWDGTHVWVGFQNTSTKDGSPPNGFSTIVEYSADGQTVVNTWSVPGHCDGMRWDATTSKIWATSNEDNNPIFYSINPATPGDAGVTIYTQHFTDPILAGAVTPHGGGFDDLYFINGKNFVTGSAPASPDGITVTPGLPILYSWTVSGSTATFTGVLTSNASVVDQTGAAVTLNEIDPDSMSKDNNGNLVLIDQGGQDYVTIANPGTGTQTVVYYKVGTQFDDTVWVPTNTTGSLLVADATKNTIWKVDGPFTAGQMFTELPNDSSVVGVLGTVNNSDAGLASNGFATVSPVVIGMGKPTGLLWVPFQ